MNTQLKSLLAAATALALGASAPAAQADLIFTTPGAGLTDTDTQMTWERALNLPAALADGYRLPTAAELTDLFSHRIAAVTHNSSAPISDGSYSLMLASTFGSTPWPVGSRNTLADAFGGMNLSATDQPNAAITRETQAVALLISDGGSGTTPVLFETMYTHYSYYLSQANTTLYFTDTVEAGSIAPQASRALNTPAIAYTTLPPGYLDPSGHLSTNGYLMVKTSVPEPSTYALMALGLAAAAGAARRRKA